MTKRRHLTLLKQDVKIWNSWRQENSNIKLDFSDANLSDLNLSGANLSEINLSGVDFQGTNLRCAYLKRANLYQACLVNANLSGSDLSEAELTEANLTNADVSDANLKDADLTNSSALCTNFKNSIFTGVCLENWQIDSSTNLEKLACDYFYAKSKKQQRYPQDEKQNFAPGEYYRFISTSSDDRDVLILTDDNSQENIPKAIQGNNDAAELLDDLWAEEPLAPSLERSDSSRKRLLPSNHLSSHATNSNIAQSDRVERKNSIIQLSLAFVFGIILTAIALGQIFEKTPRVSDNFMSCDRKLIKQARDAIFVRDEANLKQIMTLLEDFNSPLGGFADEKCRETLYEIKYTYAIEIKANQEHNLLEAVELLCELPEQYYQNKEHQPWFSRWVNTFANTNFPQQLADYVEVHGCPAADYLNQN